jgi:hypothetical protein
MVKKTIDQLDDGAALQEAGAEVAFTQNGTTFRGRVRPNPTQQINVINQAQLEAALGVNLEIPDATNVTIVIDGGFDLTTSIKLGLGSGLELKFSTIGPALEWMGTGPMIENTTPGEGAGFLIINSVNVGGDNTNSFIDLEIGNFGFAAIRSLNVDDLDSIGTIASPTVFMSSLTGFNISKGLIFDNCARVTLDNAVQGNFSETNTTWFTFLNDVTAGRLTIRDASASNSGDNGDTLLFLDPNSVANTRFTITESAITGIGGAPGEFYQLGSDIGISSVTNGAPNAEFNTAAPHGLVVGKPVVLSGFATSAYNGTFIVTAVDTPETGTQFETGVAFDIDESIGTMNQSSLDQTDIKVDADKNPDSPNSQTIGAAFVNANAVVTTIALMDTFQDLDFGALTASASMERFLLTNAVNGEFTYIGLKSIKVPLTMSITIRKVGGATAVYDIKFVIDKGSGFVDFADNVILPFEVKTENDNGGYECQAALDTGDIIKPQIEGVGTTDSVIADSVSIDF